MGGSQAEYQQKADVYNLITQGRYDAIVAMGEDAIPGLASILRNGEHWQQSIAIKALGEIKGPKALRALKIAARDEYVGVRKLAAIAINAIEGKAADKALKKMEEDPSGMIRNTANNLLLRRRSSAPPKPPAIEKNGNVLKARAQG